MELKVSEQNRPLLQAIFQQNWENVRHIKNERLMFINIYAIISAGVLSFLNSVKGEIGLQTLLILFLCFLSAIGLLSSLRLKAELEECLANIERILDHAGLENFMAMGATNQGHMRFPKFRWVFPIFYSFTSLIFSLLLLQRLWMLVH
jgi:hypothetical protein